MNSVARTGWTSRFRVLAALEGSDQPLPSPVIPQSWTREGIATRLGLDPSVVSRHLASLVREGLLESRLYRVEGMGRRRKVARHTFAGATKIRDARANLLSQELVIEVNSGRLERRPLAALTHLWADLQITDTLGLVEWMEAVIEPVSLSAGPEPNAQSRLDDRLVHWVMAGASTRDEAIERAGLLLTRPLSVSAMLRWQLELLASEASPDNWRPEPLPGMWAETCAFLLNGSWDEAPPGQSSLIDAMIALQAGKASQDQKSLVHASLQRGASKEWSRILNRNP